MGRMSEVRRLAKSAKRVPEGKKNEGKKKGGLWREGMGGSGRGASGEKGKWEEERPGRCSPFQERVYAFLSEVPHGRVTTYGDLARLLGTSPRAIGQVLKKNPFAPRVPCHRVVASDGRLGGFKGSRSGEVLSEKERLLTAEGVLVINGRIKGFEGRRYRFRRWPSCPPLTPSPSSCSS